MVPYYVQELCNKHPHLLIICQWLLLHWKTSQFPYECIIIKGTVVTIQMLMVIRLYTREWRARPTLASHHHSQVAWMEGKEEG